jgi:hypothetical protein
MNTYNIFVKAHGGLRWVLLAFLLAAIIKSALNASNSGQYPPSNRKIALFGLIFLHVQLLLGLFLYFQSPTVEIALQDMSKAMKDPFYRFWAVEHISMMLLAVVAGTIGYSKAKRKTESGAKHRTILIYYSLALILIIAAIPWPFREAISRPLF